MLMLLLLYKPAVKAQEVEPRKESLRPDFAGIQYAGSIGFISVSAGYFSFQDRARMSLSIGRVPTQVGGPLTIAAAKFYYIPKKYSLNETTSFNPFDVGLMISYHFGNQFHVRWPESRYPKNYYWWSPAFRAHLLWAPSVTITMREHTLVKNITAYVEFNSNDLYLVSFVANTESLRVEDVVKSGAGLRFGF